MLTKLSKKTASLLGMAGVATAVLLTGAGEAAASATSSGQGCFTYTTPSYGAIATVCRTWTDNGNGTYDGTWKTTWKLNNTVYLQGILKDKNGSQQTEFNDWGLYKNRTSVVIRARLNAEYSNWQ